VFSRFHRAGEKQKEGLGLGLYITRGLVEAHGGRIWVESAPGGTTTFSFTLPAMQGEARWQPPEPRPPKQDAPKPTH
jgi:signal transduction histidine kinase